ncbi:MAG: autotransporter outer membrane beta-barrel domain-containing protein, partial [Endomicrobium sp.]|nr:autotransporter outer membrane beta-barrel domain-containing protein [Endomicrobium sp.]
SDKDIHKTFVGGAQIYGTLSIASDFISNNSDMIIASTNNAIGAEGKIIIGAASHLIIDADRINTIGNSIMTILEAKEISGTFNLNPTNINTIDYSLAYYPDRVDLIIRRWSDFAEMNGLSKNQKDMAILLDEISKDYVSVKRETLDAVSDIYLLDSKQAKLKYMDNLSGVFIANVLSASLNYDDIGKVYNRLNRNALSEESKQLWFQTGISGRNSNSDENCSEDFSVQEYSITAGLDILKNDNLIFGAYLQYGNQNFKQEESRGGLNNYEMGIYAMKRYALNISDIFIKGNISLGFQNYSLHRDISLPNKNYNADSSFNTNAIQAALQGEYGYNKFISFFAGFNSAVLTNPNIEEENGGIVGLKIKDGSNARISGLFGIDMEGKYKKLDWAVKIYGKQILYGAESKITINFLESDIGQKAEISSIKEGFSGGISGNIEYPLSDSVSLSGGNSLNIGETILAYSFNLNLNYKIPIQKNSEDIEIEEKLKQAQYMADNKMYLKANDLLLELLSQDADLLKAQGLQQKINANMDNYLSSQNLEDTLYAKAFFSYYDKEYSEACEQWYKYIQYKNDNEEVISYYNKTMDAFKKNEDSYNREEDSAKAERMFKNGIAKFNKALWLACIKDMEKLQTFARSAKLDNASEYNKKTKDYIETCIKRLSANMQEEQGQEKEMVIDEQTAEEKYQAGLTLYSEGKYFEAQRMWELSLRLIPYHKKAKLAIINLKNSGHISK